MYIFLKTISRAGVEPTALTVLRLCHNQLDHPDICKYLSKSINKLLH